MSDDEGSSLQATPGVLDRDSPGNWCIVSFPATFGQDQWNAMVNGGFNLACVWTGKDDSPMEDWFKPWKENVRYAKRNKMKLLVIGHSCNDHRINKMKGGVKVPVGDGRSFRLGNGQVLEVDWMNRHNIKYRVMCGVSPPLPQR